MQDLANSKPLAIERVLWAFKGRVEQAERDSPKRKEQTEEADQREGSFGGEGMPRVSKVEELREVHKLLRQKIEQVEGSIRRKD